MEQIRERSFIEVLKRFFCPMKQMKWVWFVSFLVMLNWHLFDLATVVATKEVGDAVESLNMEYVKTILVVYIIYFVVSYGIKYLTKTHGWIRTKYTLAKIIWADAYHKYFKFDMNASERIWTGKMMHIIDKWNNSRADMNRIIQYTLSDIFSKLLIVWYLLVQLWWVYAIIFVILFLFLIWLSTRIYENKVQILRRKKKEVGVRNSWQMVRMLMSKMEILQANRIDEEIDTYNEMVSEQELIAYANMKRVFRMFNTSLMVVQAFFPIILLYVIYSTASGTFSYGMFVWLSVAAGTLGQFILKTTDAYKKVIDYYVDVEKLRNTIDLTPEIQWYDEWNTFEYKVGKVNIDNITYAYDENKVFENFSLDIAWWKKTALVWISWSGKSTLVKLIAWYLRPDTWAINIDDQDLLEVSLKSYYTHIWYLTQEPSVFDGTVLDNLTYAIDGEVNETLLTEAIKNAKCEFVYEFPDGLETQIGEKWIRLSWGQRQRLAIAKIFLKDPKIIILDEPTSALDSFSEEAITEAMHNLFEWRTVIIIAHRLQTVKEADDIILLEEGKVVERGTHKELVALWGQYNKMLELQSWF